MSRAPDRQYFAITLGWLALAADAVIFAQSVASFRLEAFWTFRWIISVVLVFGLFGAGTGLLNVGGSQRSSRISMTAFGLAFPSASTSASSCSSASRLPSLSHASQRCGRST
jgi:hypothetical protein